MRDANIYLLLSSLKSVSKIYRALNEDSSEGQGKVYGFVIMGQVATSGNSHSTPRTAIYSCEYRIVQSASKQQRPKGDDRKYCNGKNIHNINTKSSVQLRNQDSKILKTKHILLRKKIASIFGNFFKPKEILAILHPRVSVLLCLIS